MSVASEVFSMLAGDAVLAAYVGTRIYPDIAPQDVAVPYIVWGEVNVDPSVNISDGDVVETGLDNYLIQVSCYARTRDLTREVNNSVRDIMAASTSPRVVYRTSRSMPFEEDTKLFCMQSDFSVWLRT